MKKILLLGASGSIGTQTLDIIRDYPNEFELVGFSVGKNLEKAKEILKEFKTVKHVYIRDKKHAKELKKEFGARVYSGKCGLNCLIHSTDFDQCVDALVGFVGLEPAIRVLKKNKILCLANKEALVAGGTIINKLLGEGKGKLYPIDSEHVALAGRQRLMRRSVVRCAGLPPACSILTGSTREVRRRKKPWTPGTNEHPNLKAACALMLKSYANNERQKRSYGAAFLALDLGTVGTVLGTIHPSNSIIPEYTTSGTH